MTLFAHRLLDAARGKNPRERIGTEEGSQHDTLKTILDGVAKAEKFDFGRLPLEPLGSPASGFSLGQWKLPDLSPDEWDFWRDGFIPLPAENCWFEYQLGTSRTGILVSEDPYPNGTSWMVNQVDLRTIDQENKPCAPFFYWDGVVIEADKAASSSTITNSRYWSPPHIKARAKEYGHDWFVQNYGSRIPLSVYLCLMLNSRTADKRPERAPERLNRQRARAGRVSVYDHTVVDLAPIRYLDYSESRGEGGERRPPRMHWRISHKRHYKERPLRTTEERWRWMPSEVWMGSTGWWVTVIPRQLIAKASAEAVTHEYRVHLQEPVS